MQDTEEDNRQIWFLSFALLKPRRTKGQILKMISDDNETNQKYISQIVCFYERGITKESQWQSYHNNGNEFFGESSHARNEGCEMAPIVHK